MQINQTIKFRLDGKREGVGIIQEIDPISETIVVELTEPCKEFEKGSKIFVFKDEIVP